MKALPVLATASHAFIPRMGRTTLLFVLAVALSACGDDGSPANVPPSASFTVTPPNGAAPLTVSLDASASMDTDGSIASYSWNFGDGSPAGLGLRTSHTYSVPGTFSITLTVVDDRGRSATSSNSVGVRVRAWLQAASMDEGRGDSAASVLSDGSVLVTGGYTPRTGADTTFWSSAELYDPVTNTWSTAASMSGVRAGHTATTLLDGSVLVAGGGHRWEPGLFIYLSSVEIYDAVRKTWSPVADMSEARFGHTATLLSDGRVLVVGGTGGNEQFPTLQGAELYDPVTNTWTQAASLTRTRKGHTATVLPGGQVLIAGGMDGSAEYPDAELYDPAANIWTLAGPMTEVRDSHTATLLLNGKVLVAGGGVPPRASAEIYDPSTNSWTPAARMPEARDGHTATLLPSGKVLVAGGMGGDPPGFNRILASAALYDPASDSWSPVDDMLVARNWADAVPLLGGQVLVMGGWDGATFRSSCEVFK